MRVAALLELGLLLVLQSDEIRAKKSSSTPERWRMLLACLFASAAKASHLTRWQPLYRDQQSPACEPACGLSRAAAAKVGLAAGPRD